MGCASYDNKARQPEHVARGGAQGGHQRNAPPGQWGSDGSRPPAEGAEGGGLDVHGSRSGGGGEQERGHGGGGVPGGHGSGHVVAVASRRPNGSRSRNRQGGPQGQQAGTLFHQGYIGELNERAMKQVLEDSRRAFLIGELPHEPYDPERHKDLKECELCLEDYVAGDELLRLPCMHLFHASCVSEWLRKSGTCPVCQMDACQAANIG
eukprot:TRINITY_DN31252_c0_g1_i2.p1 TRINITY_DN31252_c0_g1~~TRINITY_DN31252_c0_g1_i2.p1  ORF type:complete len:208 (-),score=46.58 TRINITY_DN31252_c0_g1_i2:187-810(-)